MAEITQNQDSRRVFIDTLCELAENDPMILLVICDTGFNYIEKFQNKFPNRFFNFGVTEQSSVLIATAMALSGFKVYFYSMINFVAFRPFEMVRNGIHCHKANVKLIGVKGSEKYKFLGFSHNMLYEDEDIEILKRYLICYISTSPEHVRQQIISSYEHQGAAYIRL